MGRAVRGCRAGVAGMDVPEVRAEGGGGTVSGSLSLYTEQLNSRSDLLPDLLPSRPRSLPKLPNISLYLPLQSQSPASMHRLHPTSFLLPTMECLEHHLSFLLPDDAFVSTPQQSHSRSIPLIVQSFYSISPQPFLSFNKSRLLRTRPFSADSRSLPFPQSLPPHQPTRTSLDMQRTAPSSLPSPPPAMRSSSDR
jgi:hypothetical protein